MIEKFWGTCIRNIPSTGKILYLTFDDGPHEYCTPRVLNLLLQYQAKATFFVVADALHHNLAIGRSIVAHGHTIGNHSLDHKYHHFFGNTRYLMNWISRARDSIEQSLQIQTVGFRSPLGLRTHHLGTVLQNLEYPLIHWNQRFYDTRWGLPRTILSLRIPQFQAGDIILLHDTHRKYHQSFLEGLETLLVNSLHAGFSFQSIPSNLAPCNLKLLAV